MLIKLFLKYIFMGCRCIARFPVLCILGPRGFSAVVGTLAVRAGILCPGSRKPEFANNQSFSLFSGNL
jgi:hypothetical protein